MTESQATVELARTPLHALTLRLDNVAHSIEDGDLDTAGRDVERAAVEVERLAGLVEALLVLERADRATQRPLEELDLARLVRSRLPDWKERATRSGVDIEVALPERLPALARAVQTRDDMPT